MDNAFVNGFLIPTFSIFVPFWVMYIRKSEKRKRFVQYILIPFVLLVTTILYLAAGYYYFLGPELANQLFDSKYLFFLLVFMTSTWALQKMVTFCLEVVFDLRG
ncbi:hypothetical protein vBVipa36_00012 [Vibrio phage vB_Vipa36]|uniref:Uncharacterized protein n=1 Tax=Vibrio phage vB_Vipa36 TaxID=2729568 RepID=A0AAE7DHL4_9VIRU|nr:hypothetical protein vBVipa36_00012 [Vibrio phage vB_Vipa36]TOG77183.1 hypothetical protein CGI94_18575 [Vibrio parahaemolyticus]